MFKNFLLVTFRNFRRNKVYVFINVLGLGLALALCIVAYYNYQFAAEYDHNHEHLDELYMVNVTKSVNDDDIPYGITPLLLYEAMTQDGLPYDNISRFNFTYDAIKFGENVFNTRIGYADEDFFKMFTFPTLSGDTPDISDRSAIYITEKTAEKFFGEEDPVGEILVIKNYNNENFEYTVAGVVQNPPLNTSMQVEAFTHFDNFKKMDQYHQDDGWRRFIPATFVQLKDPSRAEVLTNQLQKYIPIQNKSREDWIVSSFYLQPMETVASNGRDMNGYWLWEAIHPAAVIAPSIMSLMVLLIACFNFTNTSISFSNQRLKEIGVRKVLGGRKAQLIMQFLGENMILCVLAMAVALLFAAYLVPGYSAMWEYLDLEMNFTEDLPFYIFLVGLLLFTGLIAGLYPAFYVSGFQPVKILNRSLKVKSTSLLSLILLTAQFSISIVALVSGVVFTQNAQFQNDIDLGYEKENLINIPVNNREEYVSFKNEIASHTKIKALAGSHSHIDWSYYGRTIKNEQNTQVDAKALDVGANYISTLKMNLKAGRHFDEARGEAERNESVIINELVATQMNWDNPIGQILIMQDTLRLNVIGVVENFYINDFYGPVEPTVFRLTAEEENRLLIAQVEEEDMVEVNKYFESTWKNLHPYSPYQGFYQYEILEDARVVNNNIVYIFLFLAVLAIIMSGIGLYTLVSMQIMNKTKEMGIRKVLGASIAHLMGLINKRFIIILLIASVIGAIAGLFLTDLLMSSIYEVYIDMNVISFMVPVIFTLIFAVLTIGGKVFKASNRNPVESLRYE